MITWFQTLLLCFSTVNCKFKVSYKIHYIVFVNYKFESMRNFIMRNLTELKIVFDHKCYLSRKND